MELFLTESTVNERKGGIQTSASYQRYLWPDRTRSREGKERDREKKKRQKRRIREDANVEGVGSSNGKKKKKETGRQCTLSHGRINSGNTR